MENAPDTSFNSGVGGNSSNHARPSLVSTAHSSTSSTTSSTRKDSRRHQMSLDNSVTSPEENNVGSTFRSRAKTVESLAKSGKYTQVVAPLPANLRSEDMIMVPMVTEEQLTKCENLIKEPTDLTAEPPSPTAAHSPRPSDARATSKQPSSCTSDYVDPVDARRPSNLAACSNNDESGVAWAQAANASGKKRTTSNADGSPCVVRPPGLDDYTQVSDALPENKFERVGSQRVYKIESRTQPSSETSPVLSARSAGSGNMFQTTPGGAESQKVQKSQSVHRKEPLDGADTSPAKMLKRRSTSDNKEMVSFSPRTGFKLESRSDGGSNSPEASSANKKSLGAVARPMSSPVFSRRDIPDDVFTTSGQHEYAAVNLTAKCRPRDDLIRKEGVGTPDHYVACTN